MALYRFRPFTLTGRGEPEILRGAVVTGGFFRILGVRAVAALDAGLCDAVVSGVAGVLPELTTSLFHQRNSPAYPQAVELLTDLIGHLSALPVPWGLKLIAECRGITPAWFSQPLSATRTTQAKEFREWFPARWAQWQDAMALSR